MRTPPQKDPPAPALPRHWKTTAPVVADGKMVFTPPDAPSIHCLNLTDGALLWSRKKNDDEVYLAGVHGGKVLIVGAKSVQALSLTKGELLWACETGLPSGQGIAAGDVYYLPLQRGVQSKQPEIMVLDINKGQVIAHHKTRPRQPKGDDFDGPGNLVFVEGKLISLTPWEIVAYPPRGGK
jgi:outer membrane protein assembly factor BamB